MDRRTFLARAAGGAVVAAPLAAKAAVQGGFNGVAFQAVSAVANATLGVNAAQSAVLVATGNTKITNYIDQFGFGRGPQLTGLNNDSSVFAHVLIWLKDNVNAIAKRVLYSVSDPNTGQEHFNITLWPGNVQATVQDTAGNIMTYGGSGGALPYLVVQAISFVANQTIFDSWVVVLDAWQGNTPMMIDVAMHGAQDTPYGLVVNQFLKGTLANYNISKFVRWGFSNALRPPVNVNKNSQRNFIPWGSTDSIVSSNNQLIHTIGGSLSDTLQTGASGLTIGGFAATFDQGNQISTKARLIGTSGQFLLPPLGSASQRFANVFNFGAAPPPIALFGSIDPGMSLLDPAYFGNNFGLNPTQIGGSFYSLDTSFYKAPQSDTLVEDLTDFFQ